VVDQPDEQLLGEALRRLIHDRERVAERATRGRRLALERHDVAVVARQFEALLREVSRTVPPVG
jgi:hypothetical protein